MVSAPKAKPAETGAVPDVITIPPNTPLASQISVYHIFLQAVTRTQNLCRYYCLQIACELKDFGYGFGW